MNRDDKDPSDSIQKDPDDGATEIMKATPIAHPTVILQSPPVAVGSEAWSLRQKEIDRVLAKARQQLAGEDFRDAMQTVDAVLSSDPHHETAKALREEVQQTADRHVQNILDQGIQFYVDSHWDTAIATWKKAFLTFPNHPTASEWIHKAEVKKEQERIIRAGLLRELEKCGKFLSDRNFVVAEEHLEQLKDRFTAGFHLVDLQRIYEALLVRTRVALEKEFEDLRSSEVDVPAPVPAAKEQQNPESALLKKYMEAFETGKKHFDKGDWQKALSMWENARQINPADGNLIHWIALAQSHLIQEPSGRKQSPVSTTIAVLSVFFMALLIAYLGYQKYTSYVKETKNQELIQRAIEHYRAGRLEESWKTLQIYVLQDPQNESASQLLEKITYEMRIRQTMEKNQSKINVLLKSAEQQRNTQQYPQAINTYEAVLNLDPANLAARRSLDELKTLTSSNQSHEKVETLLSEAEALRKERRLDAAYEKTGQVLYLDPQNSTAVRLRERMDLDRSQMNRLSVQLELAAYLNESRQKDAAIMILNRILSADPGQPQAKQLLAKIKGTPSAPLATVEIRIQPPARLFMDGRDMGTRDFFQQNESIGSHILHIERLGYRSLDQAIEVKRGERNVFTFQLKPY